LLEQKANTALQHISLSKLLGLNYKIEYKKGIDNKVVDALSRSEGLIDDCVYSLVDLQAFTELVPQWVSDLKSSYVGDFWIEELQHRFQNQDPQHQQLTMHQGLLRYKERICVRATHNWRQQLLKEVHDSAQGGHFGMDVTLHRLKRMFYWPAMKTDVINYVRSCPNCQMNKPERLHTPGLLQPLPIPIEAWSSIGMDFITGLPKFKGKSVIMVVVDRLTKFAHLLPLARPYTTLEVATTFLDNIYKIHGLPSSIISAYQAIFGVSFSNCWVSSLI
jgi:Integrase zinc binding domain